MSAHGWIRTIYANVQGLCFDQIEVTVGLRLGTIHIQPAHT
jgi:hypothetical protein